MRQSPGDPRKVVTKKISKQELKKVVVQGENEEAQHPKSFQPVLDFYDAKLKRIGEMHHVEFDILRLKGLKNSSMELKHVIPSTLPLFSSDDVDHREALKAINRAGWEDEWNDKDLSDLIKRLEQMVQGEKERRLQKIQDEENKRIEKKAMERLENFGS